MKKFFSLFLLAFFFSIDTYSQYVHKIKADSVLITNDSCNAELNLENSTKNVNGFLYNKSNGRTEFRKGLIKINDTLYIIGNDTLNIAEGIGGNYIRNQNTAAQPANFWVKGDNIRIDKELRIAGDNLSGSDEYLRLSTNDLNFIRRKAGETALDYKTQNQHRFYNDNAGADRYVFGTSQVGSVLINTQADVPASILTVASTSKGWLKPRMSTIQRDAIASPVAGLEIYNTTTKTTDYHNGTAWISGNYIQNQTAALQASGSGFFIEKGIFGQSAASGTTKSKLTIDPINGSYLFNITGGNSTNPNKLSHGVMTMDLTSVNTVGMKLFNIAGTPNTGIIPFYVNITDNHTTSSATGFDLSYLRTAAGVNYSTYGFKSTVDSYAGTGYAYYANATATGGGTAYAFYAATGKNYFADKVLIGSSSDAGAKLQVSNAQALVNLAPSSLAEFTGNVVNLTANMDNLNSDPILLNVYGQVGNTPRGYLMKLSDGRTSFEVAPTSNGKRNRFAYVGNGSFTNFKSTRQMLAVGINDSLWWDGHVPVAGLSVNMSITGWGGTSPQVRNVLGSEIKVKGANPSGISYGLYVDVDEALHNWGIYSIGSASKNYFQSNVLIGTTNVIPSSKLTIESTTQGFLKPRMTTIQRNAIASPVAGLEIYNTTTNTTDYHNGSAWVSGNYILNQLTASQTANAWINGKMLLGSITDQGAYNLQVGGDAIFKGPSSTHTVQFGFATGLSGRIVASGTGLFVRADASRYLSLGANGLNDIIRIETTGNVLIGTTTDNGNKLQVAGNAYINGKQSIGTTSNGALLHLAAGTATANTAPLKFTSGTTLTTPENGAVEYDGTNYFVTSANTRYTLAKTLTATATLDFTNTAAQTTSDLTVTVTGATDGDAVSLGVPNVAVNNKSSYSAWVSAANTVTVRFSNNDLTNAIDPASGTFRVSIIKY